MARSCGVLAGQNPRLRKSARPYATKPQLGPRREDDLSGSAPTRQGSPEVPWGRGSPRGPARGGVTEKLPAAGEQPRPGPRYRRPSLCPSRRPALLVCGFLLRLGSLPSVFSCLLPRLLTPESGSCRVPEAARITCSVGNSFDFGVLLILVKDFKSSRSQNGTQ